LLLKPSNSLIDQSLDCRQGKTRTNGDGFGIGWYGSRSEPGLYREVLPAWNDCNLRALARQIKSPLFFAHVRASTGTETARLNCHPFSYGKWLFMHNGKIGGYDLCRRQLESLLCDELFKDRLGSTDSELFFLLLIQNGLESDPAAALSGTIRQIT
jgi:predicted glutamine amidotransferase